MFILFLCELFSFHWIHINSIKKYFLKVFKPLFILVNVCVSTFKKGCLRERGGVDDLPHLLNRLIFSFQLLFFFSDIFLGVEIFSQCINYCSDIKKKHINTICLINYSFISLHKCIAICFRKHESFRALDWTS